MALRIKRRFDSFLIIVGEAKTRTQQVGLLQLCCSGKQKHFSSSLSDQTLKMELSTPKQEICKCTTWMSNSKIIRHYSRKASISGQQSNLLTYKCSSTILIQAFFDKSKHVSKSGIDCQKGKKTLLNILSQSSVISSSFLFLPLSVAHCWPK